MFKLRIHPAAPPSYAMCWDFGVSEVAIAATLLGTAVSAYGMYSQGQAQAAQQRYQAQVAQNNAAIAQQNARWAAQVGETQATQQGLKTRAIVGAERAGQAAEGINTDTGSAVDVRSSASELGELDALTIRSNAARQQYGYNVQSTSYQAQAGLDTMAAKNDVLAGDIGAAGSLLSGAGRAAGQYAQWQQANPGGAGGGGDLGVSTMSGVNNPYTY